MRWIIFALAFGFVESQQVHYEPVFGQKKTYLYQYEGVLLTGLPDDGLAKGGVKITSKVQISSMGQKNHLLKVISPQIEEYSGIWPDEDFVPAQKLTQKLSPQLSQPVMFEYSRGRVGNIFAPPDIPENIVNIHRGILNILQISIKKNQNIYELQENGLEGICQVSYTIQEDRKARHITVIKSKDLNNCQEKVSESKGGAYSQPCETCQQKGKNLRSVSTYTYILKNTEEGAEISEVVSQETHQFTPFNELDSAAVTESRQHLYLLDFKDQSPPMPKNPMEKRGSLRYQFSNELLQMPMQLVRTSHNDTKITKLVEELAQINQVKAHPDAPQMFLQLVQLLRSTNLINLQSIWERESKKQSQRQWILDTIPTTGTHEAVQFIQSKIEQEELSQFEAAQALIFVLHAIKPDCHGVDNATVLLSSPYMQKNPFLRKITLLAYGSLVQKYCNTVQFCPDEALQPLHELVVEAGSRGHEEETILGLKAIGNAGQPASLKRIQKLLPGFSSSANAVSNRIQAVAVMALRNIGKKDPRKVRSIAMQLFMNKRNRAEMRIQAFIVLLETKPSLASVVTATDAMTRETNLHLTSFVYSYMKSLAATSVPELQSLAAIFNIAVKRLNQKCDKLSYQYSKGFHFGQFRDEFLAGIDANLYLIKKSEGILPTIAIANFKLYGLGVSTEFLEIGIQVEGLLQALLKSRKPNWRGPKSKGTERVVETVSGWKPMPTLRPLVNVYIKLSGQELLYVELNQNNIQEAMKIMSNQARMNGLMRKLIYQLLRGISTKWTKPLLASEVRHMVPTSLGLPLELAFYYTIVSAVTAKAKMKLALAPYNLTLPQLLNISVQIETQLTPSSVKDVVGIMGINSALMQTGVEVRLKTCTVIPVNFTARLNHKKRNVKIESPPWQRETQLFSASTQAFAFSRNIEDLASAKVTPLLPSDEDGMRIRLLRLARNSTADHIEMMDRVLPLAIPRGSVCSAEEPPDGSRSTVQKSCMKANTFGFEVCSETSVVNNGFTTNAPLYKLVGEKSIRVAIKPVITPIPVKTLQVELQMQTRDLPFSKASHPMKRNSRNATDFSEAMQAEGKLVNLRLKKILQAKDHHQERRDHGYATSSITSSSQTSSRQSIRRSQGNKEDPSRTYNTHSSTWSSRESKRGRHGKHQMEGHIRHNSRSPSDSPMLSRNSRRRSKEVDSRPYDTQPLTSLSEEFKHGHRGRHGKHRQEKHVLSTSGSQIWSRSRENKKKSLQAHGPHSSITSSEESRHGRHQQRHQQRGRHVASSSSESLAHQSLSSSSSSGLAKEKYAALPRGGSSKKSRRQQLPSSPSSSQSWQQGRSRHGQAGVKNCHSCRDELPSQTPRWPSIGNSSLPPSSTSLGSSNSDSFSEERYDEQPKSSLSSSSSSSESSSSHSSSAESRHQQREQAAQSQTSSSMRGDSASDSYSWHRGTLKVWPTARYRSGADRRCKNGKCIWTHTKRYSTTIHKVKTHRKAWISDPEAQEQGGTERNVFQLHFQPTSINTSRNKGRLSYSSSFKSTSDARTSSSSFISSSSSSSSSEQSSFLEDIMPPIFSLFTRAILIDNKEEGYQTRAYVDTSMDQRIFQVFVDELQDGGNWKACINAKMPNVHRAMGVLKWGKDCEDYKIAAKATTGHFKHHTAMQLKAKWDKIPQSIKEAAERLADDLSNFAFMLGFSQRHQKSPPHQLSVIIAATSQRTLDVVIKTSKHIFNRQALVIPAPLPFDVTSPSVHQRGLQVLTDLPAMISLTSTAECTVMQDTFTQFNNNSFNYQMPENCAHILVQDCTIDLNFLVMIRHSGEKMIVQLHFHFSEIIIESTTTGDLQLTVNGTKMPITSLPFSSSRFISIERSALGLKIKASVLGLESLFFDGKVIKVAMMPWMDGATCGLCGQGSSQGSHEYQQPNRRKSTEVLKFAHSWLLPGESCNNTCKLTKTTVKLDRPIKLHGQDSKCYSVEPVLRCRIGCSPVKTVPVTYGFHCLPADSSMNPTDEELKYINFGPKSEDIASTIDAHIACSCPSECK